jgi:hypothetical protein
MALFGSKPSVDTAAERTRLESLCRDVEAGLAQFRKIGDALSIIQAEQLYRLEADTFADFVLLRWKMSPQHANRLMAAAMVCKELEPTGFTPQTERQARPLTSLSPTLRVEAWKEASEHADEQGLVPTAAIAASVAKRSPKKPRKTKSLRPIRIRVPGASVIIQPNKHFTGDVAQVLTRAIAKLAETEGRKAA